MSFLPTCFIIIFEWTKYFKSFIIFISNIILIDITHKNKIYLESSIFKHIKKFWDE